MNDTYLAMILSQLQIINQNLELLLNEVKKNNEKK